MTTYLLACSCGLRLENLTREGFREALDEHSWMTGHTATVAVSDHVRLIDLTTPEDDSPEAAS